MSSSISKISLGGKSYRLVRFRGDSDEAQNLVWAKDHRWLHPGNEEPQTMAEWFCIESGGDSAYLHRLVFQKDTDVYGIIGKDKEPIGFFSLYKSSKEALLGAFYLKKSARGKSVGKEMILRAITIAQKSGFLKVRVPQMSEKGENAVLGAARIAQQRKRALAAQYAQHSELGGPDAIIPLIKRIKQRRKRLI